MSRPPRFTRPFVMLIMIAVGATISTKTQAAFPGQNGLIASQRNGFGGQEFQEIYVMNGDGTGQRSLGGGAYPSWSPDGTRIVFTHLGGKIWVMNADGSNRTQITFTPNATDIFPVWSPDGSRIAFASFNCCPIDVNYDIWVINIDGSNATNLTQNPHEDILPSWQPGGERIAFQTNRNGPTEIYTINSDGTGLTNVSNAPEAFDDYPDWSPDGSKIVFARYRSGYDIWVMNADGSGKLQLTTSGYESMPAWSPDGSKIVFSSFRNLNDEIYVMNANGTGAVRLTNNAAPGNTLPEDWFPDWQAIPAPANRPPDCSAAIANVPIVWPPNHQLIPVQIGGVTDPDGNPVTITVTGITQDEVVGSLDSGAGHEGESVSAPTEPGVQMFPGGGGTTCPDGRITNGSGYVRAERSGRGNGRVYAIRFTATDGLGGECTGTVSMCVPHDRGQGGVCVDDGQLFNSLEGCSPRGRGLEPVEGPTLVARVAKGVTVLEYALAEDGEVELAVYDLSGRRISTIEKGVRAAGDHTVSWNAKGMPNGVYFVLLRAGSVSVRRSVVVAQ